ncbi:hypothetical protein M4S82_10450 [Planococcus sp. MERTA32b]|nr:hypothetical protein [Planococcus sp. MER TA 32b]
MDSPILQFILILGVLYGLITFYIEVKRKSAVSKYQVGLSFALIVACTAAFLMTLE